MPGKKYLAEFIGAFLLTLAVSVSVKAGGAIPTPVVAGLALGLGVYFVGCISGEHFNPEITIALAAMKKIDWKTTCFYIAAQVAGAGLAILVIQFLFGAGIDLNNDNSKSIFLVEAMGAFVLALGVAAVVQKKVKEEMAGIVIGSSLLLGLTLTGGVSPGILNPAVAVGLQAISATYLLAPVVGAIAAMFLYNWVANK